MKSQFIRVYNDCMNYWLMKTEPETFSLDDLKHKGREHWDGVRNFQARNNMKAMQVNDLVFIYHSGIKKGIVGIAKVVKPPYPDFTAFDPKSHYFDPKSSESNPTWYMVDVEYVETLPRMITLEEIKQDGRFDDMPLVKSGRLSVQPVTRQQFGLICELAK